MFMIRRKLPGKLMVALVGMALSACGDDGTGPDGIVRADILGTFDATTFTVTEGGSTTDLLQAGGDIELTLEGNGTTTGRIFVPEQGEGGTDLDESLAGTYAFDEATGRVTFDQAADTFVRDVDFTAVRSGGKVLLQGTETFGTATVNVVLTRR